MLPMCSQLAELLSKFQAEQLEGDKVRQLLAYEETRRCDLEGALDQAQKHARDQQQTLQNQVPVHLHTRLHVHGTLAYSNLHRHHDHSTTMHPPDPSTSTLS